MPLPILTTKLFKPKTRRSLVARPRLLAQLDEGLDKPITLVSAGAGFGKTTLVGEWIAGCGCEAAWLSLDEGDNDPARFLAYLIAALQTVSPKTGLNTELPLQSPQAEDIDTALAGLINDLAGIPRELVIVLDDYHLIHSPAVEDLAVALIMRLPEQVHITIVTREDPRLPLARMRARGQLCELRAADLRFTVDETACFLSQVMGLDLGAADAARLEERTEGWIAGLQLAAISLRGQKDPAGFIRSFAGSHRYVLDYLLEEVLQQQPPVIQDFLLRTSILERMCAPLCEAVLGKDSPPGQATLEAMERSNLFIVPLDGEHRWYRYHHLFSDLLRQRLDQSAGRTTAAVNGLHIRASRWFEENGLEMEAFEHAASGHDVERAERLIEGKGMPLHFRGGLARVLNWLGSLPEKEMNEHPSLWSTYASVLLGSGQSGGIEEKLQSAEKAMAARGGVMDEKARDLAGRLASTRALLALSRIQADEIIHQGRLALELLSVHNRPFRASTLQTLAYGYLLKGERIEARRLYSLALADAQASGNIITIIMSSLGLGQAEEADLRLEEAEEAYRRALDTTGDMLFPIVGEAYRGLAQIAYQRNRLEEATDLINKCEPFARRLINTDRSLACEVFRARLALAAGETGTALEVLERTSREAREKKFFLQAAETAELRTRALAQLGREGEALREAEISRLPLVMARALLAAGKPAEALAMADGARREAEEKAWSDHRLNALVLVSLARDALGDQEGAVSILEESLVLARPGGMLRIFIDEGPAMMNLIQRARVEGTIALFAGRILAGMRNAEKLPRGEGAVEGLSARELDVLRLAADGLSNNEIGGQLFLALSTVKGHMQTIFAKLHVRRRTEAVARARELGLL